jgi:hypothetical protein
MFARSLPHEDSRHHHPCDVLRWLQRNTTRAGCRPGNHTGSGTLGGPLIPFGGITVPTPYLNFGLIHGYRENLTLTGSIHATMALLKNAAIDVGAATRLARENDGWPELTAKG